MNGYCADRLCGRYTLLDPATAMCAECIARWGGEFAAATRPQRRNA